tara:strand:+ start:32 stop:205 length:174 start_codon:yes stop_codon:yes gene_type:complete
MYKGYHGDLVVRRSDNKTGIIMEKFIFGYPAKVCFTVAWSDGTTEYKVMAKSVEISE